MAQWILDDEGKAKRWDGGRIAQGKHGPVFHIEKMRDGKVLGGSLGPGVDINRAMIELRAFLVDPTGYKTPPQLAKEKEAAKVQAEAAKVEANKSAVIIDDKLLNEFADALTNGYENRKGRTKKYVVNVLYYLSQWATGPLRGRDLRAPTTTKAYLKDGLKQMAAKKTTKAERRQVKKAGKGAEQKRIAALKSLTAWLRAEDRMLSHEDPTIDLKCIQYERPDEETKQAKVYSPEHLQAIYGHIKSQAVRDLLRVRVFTGLHVSEIDRVVRKDRGSVEAVAGLGEIAGRVRVKHKSGDTHFQTVNADTLAAFLRLVERGHLPTPHRVISLITRAATAAGVEPIVVAHLRHTFVSLGRRAGRKVIAPNTEAISEDEMRLTVGHKSKKTTGIYDASNLPPMIVPPVVLTHPDDPAPKERHLRAVS